MRTYARLFYICGPDKTAIKLSIFEKQLTLSNSRKPNERSQKKPITYLFSVSWGNMKIKSSIPNDIPQSHCTDGKKKVRKRQASPHMQLVTHFK